MFKCDNTYFTYDDREINGLIVDGGGYLRRLLGLRLTSPLTEASRWDGYEVPVLFQIGDRVRSRVSEFRTLPERLRVIVEDGIYLDGAALKMGEFGAFRDLWGTDLAKRYVESEIFRRSKASLLYIPPLTSHNPLINWCSLEKWHCLVCRSDPFYLRSLSVEI